MEPDLELEDNSLKRPCRRCGYDLKGSLDPAVLCPECGQLNETTPPAPGRFCPFCGYRFRTVRTDHVECHVCGRQVRRDWLRTHEPSRSERDQANRSRLPWIIGGGAVLLLIITRAAYIILSSSS